MLSLLAVALAAVGTSEARIGGNDNWVRPAPGQDIDMRLLQDDANDAAQQINLRIVGNSDGKWNYYVQFATNNTFAAPATTCSAWTDDETITGTGSSTTYANLNTGGSYHNPSDIYQSPYLHKCKLEGLRPSTKYFYQALTSETLSFTTPPLAGTSEVFSAVVLADVGQTNYSNMTMTRAAEALETSGASSIIWPGDLSYADGYQPRWDTFGRLAQVLTGKGEIMWAGGNHELSSQEAWMAYQQRYAGTGPMWFTTQRGPMTLVSLCSYCNTGTDSPQYRWLEETLPTIDRALTPWLVVIFHAPMYCSDVSHQQEAEEMRVSMEPLFVEYGVDVVFSGHVHAYERTAPVNNYTVTECAPVHITIGDGGNREETANEFYQQPEWSLERDASFGFGTFDILDANLANWTWLRNPAGYFEFPGQTPFPVMPDYTIVDNAIWNRTACRT
ncbi:Purple acid phosphatase [Hondaea fermentalgiana]|uniref:Purple acid phosphatase n=1 Tax=Hondaea fermentalgiana TaxID=2315210 RepID=A0A2R5GJ11_9STRA|nr:Purple acid phosphatase [Hondaea fermentalgiana]|eukprot:GBG30876.1 Purple acid phosphatase [Hondaea fermentalgiana]